MLVESVVIIFSLAISLNIILNSNVSVFVLKILQADMKLFSLLAHVT